MPADFKYSPHFAKRRRPVSHIAQTKRYRAAAAGPVRQRKRLGRRTNKGNSLKMAGINCPSPPDPEHGWVGIADGYIRLGVRLAFVQPVDETKRDIAGAARDIDQAHVRRGFEPIDQRLLPQPVQAAAHQIIHEIVSIGNRIEHTADQTGMFVRAHAAKTKICLAIAALRSGGSRCHATTIAQPPISR